MSQAIFTLSNQQARRLSLHLQGLLATTPAARSRPDYLHLVKQLGLVQLDSIGVLARAHDHILWARENRYRAGNYDHLLRRDRAVFEHFSHDACILPMSSYPYWQRQRARRARVFRKSAWGQQGSNPKIHRELLKHIENNGPVCSRDAPKTHSQPVDKSIHAWMRPAHKLALDFMWLEGSLSVSHRSNFTKYYDLTDRVIPAEYRSVEIPDEHQIDWLCREALSRLGFGSAKEIQQFWDACSLEEVKHWLASASQEVLEIAYTARDGSLHSAWAFRDIEQQLAQLPEPGTRLRIINPFDPIARNRQRLKRLFGMDYRIEIYVPRHKRQYGYYVCLLLERDQMVGRIDTRADTRRGLLETANWWLEPGIQNSKGRQQRLQAALARLARFTGTSCTQPLPALSQFPGADNAR